MRALDIRMSGMATLRMLIAAGAVMIVAGCTAVGPPPAASAARSAPSTAGVTARTAPAAVASSTARATPTAVGLTVFTGMWTGHTRSLSVSASGVGHETVYDGCCTSQLDMTFQLSSPRGSAAHATATATVTAVVLAAGLEPTIEVGQTGTVSLVDGQLTDSLDGFTYCNQAAAARSACGA